MAAVHSACWLPPPTLRPPAPDITIMDMTTYQVKGTINELNVGTLSEGMNVLIRSRLDESVTWSGVLDSIDWETKVQTNNSPYYGGGGGNGGFAISVGAEISAEDFAVAVLDELANPAHRLARFTVAAR